MDEIKAEFAKYDPKPRGDGKYKFALSLPDLDAEPLHEVLAILTSPAAQELDDARFEFDYESRNGYGCLTGWREATVEELASIEARRSQSAKYQIEHDRRELERIKKAHPDWLADNGG